MGCSWDVSLLQRLLLNASVFPTFSVRSWDVFAKFREQCRVAVDVTLINDSSRSILHHSSCLESLFQQIPGSNIVRYIRYIDIIDFISHKVWLLTGQYKILYIYINFHALNSTNLKTLVAPSSSTPTLHAQASRHNRAVAREKLQPSLHRSPRVSNGKRWRGRIYVNLIWMYRWGWREIPNKTKEIHMRHQLPPCWVPRPSFTEHPLVVFFRSWMYSNYLACQSFQAKPNLCLLFATHGLLSQAIHLKCRHPYSPGPCWPLILQPWMFGSLPPPTPSVLLHCHSSQNPRLKKTIAHGIPSKNLTC